jgi:RHS repeat-associated protein
MLAEYVYLGDQLLAMITPGESVYYFHNDHLGTPQVLTDDTQAIAWKAVYTPFGGAVPSISTVDNPFRFPGQYYDAETGLHYNYFRYYDPTTGRYVTPDPIGLEGGINLFAYTHNNPVNWMDLFGLATVLLDPGHGDIFDKWVDPGALGSGGKHEKDYVLELAFKIGAELEKLGHKVIYTRNCDTKDKRTRWQWRADISNRVNPDLFVSLHLDSYDRSQNYFKTFYYQENARVIAENIISSINQGGLTVLGPERMGMQVFRRITAPGVLIEGGNIRNPNTSQIIADPSFARQIAEGINKSLK